jgi:hypothetical protein
MVAHAPEARRHKRVTALSESRCGSGRRMSNTERLLLPNWKTLNTFFLLCDFFQVICKMKPGTPYAVEMLALGASQEFHLAQRSTDLGW